MNNNHALLIGVGQRKEDSNAIAVTADDAKRLASELTERCQYNSANIVSLVSKEATRVKIMRQLDGLITKTQNNPANLVVIFFSGHGVKKNNNFYFISHDTENGEVDAYSAIEGKEFIQKVNAIKAKAILILLNSCYSGAIQESGFETADIPFDKSVFINTPNRAIITACNGTEKAYTSTPLSVFTYALVSGLAGECIKNSDKKAVTLFDLAMYIRETVVALSKNKQHPDLDVEKHTATTNFAIVDYSKGIPPFTKEERGGLYDSLGNDLSSEQISSDENYRKKYEWLGKMKNVVLDSNVNAGGNVHIGDTIIGQNTQQDGNYDIKNAVIGSTIKAGGDFRLGDDVISGNQNVQIVNNYFGNSPKTGEKTPPQYQTLKSELQNLIKQEKIGDAIDRFLEVAEQQNLEVHTELLLLYARYNRISKSERQNLISTADANIERNRINAALASLINDLKI